MVAITALIPTAKPVKKKMKKVMNQNGEEKSDVLPKAQSETTT